MKMHRTFFIDREPTPIGPMLIVSDEQGHLRALDWGDHEERMHKLFSRHYGAHYTLQPRPDAGGLTSALRAYLAGNIHVIDSLPVETEGTPFQRLVWHALRTIPAGQTTTYGKLAAHIGKPLAVRAVGLANGANPVGIVVPCHRVIGADASLTGYGGGLERKRWLLAHEAQHALDFTLASSAESRPNTSAAPATQ